MRTILRSIALFGVVSLSGCSSSDDDSTGVVTPVLTTITVTVGSPISIGERVTAVATGLDQASRPFTLGTVTWSTTTPAVATVTQTGEVTGVSAGSSQIVATVGAISGSVAITVNPLPVLVINEIESNGGTPGDWVEIFNPAATSVSVSGWVVKDNNDSPSYTIPAGTTIAANGYLVVEQAQMGFGFDDSDAIRLYNPFGALHASYEWTSHALTSFGRCPNATGAITQTTTPTKGGTNDCSAGIRINEIESNGGTPGDWIELHNTGNATVNISGYVFKDNDDSRLYTIPNGTSIPPNGYFVLEEAAVGFGLDASDMVRIFMPGGAILLDSHTWFTHATTTLARCPNSTGNFVQSVVATKGAANSCP